jgi:hypothetical protein
MISMSGSVPAKEESLSTHELPPRSPPHRHSSHAGQAPSSSSQAGQLPASRSKRSSAHSSRSEVQRPASAASMGMGSRHGHASAHNTPRGSRQSNHLSPTGRHSGGDNNKGTGRALYDKYLIGQELGRGAYGQVRFSSPKRQAPPLPGMVRVSGAC